MAELSSTLVTKLRQAIKDGRTTPYERFSELTNELANTHRTLWKQSQELKRLNEEKNRLLAMVTHDIRSPLTVVMNYARLLEQGFLDDDERSLAIQEVLESSRFIVTFPMES